MKRKILVVVFLSFALPVVLAAQFSWQLQFPSLPFLAYPTELVFSRDGTNRVFVVEQYGTIAVFNNTPGVSTRKTFLDISDRVSQDGGETGLLGLAFHPQFPDSAYFYVNYVRDSSGTLRSYVARFTVSPANADSALRASEKVLLTVDQPYSNHNGGKLAFGSDHFLYIGFGDGGSANDPGNRAQNCATILGKILRINVDSAENGKNYAIPPTNPFYHNGLGYREEIYAFGIRNPWKFSFDPSTGVLLLGDVGQDTREEVDNVVNGGNYGWRLKEGFICNPSVNPACQDTAGLLPPVWEYPHAGGSRSITGGYVYRGSSIPLLNGKYIFGDYVTGETWALNISGAAPASVTPLSDESYYISTFGQDPAGNLYLCSYGSNGRIYRLSGPATGVRGENPHIGFELRQNFPNPFNPSSMIEFSVARAGVAILTMSNVLGQEVAVLFDGQAVTGVTYRISLRASGLASGVYFVSLLAHGNLQRKKVLLVK